MKGYAAIPPGMNNNPNDLDKMIRYLIVITLTILGLIAMMFTV